MGYYTGSGVVTSGGQEITDAGSTYPGTSGYRLLLQCKTTRTGRVYAGYQLSTCTGKSPSSTAKFTPLTANGWTWSGDVTYENTVNYSYSRIGDSNLYALTEDTSTRQFRLGYAYSGGTGDHGYSFTNWAS